MVKRGKKTPSNSTLYNQFLSMNIRGIYLGIGNKELAALTHNYFVLHLCIFATEEEGSEQPETKARALVCCGV